MSVDLCRICLETANLSYIFEEKDENIASKLMTLCNVELAKDDGLPQFICGGCAIKIDNFLEFKNQVENSQQYFLTVEWSPENLRRNSKEETLTVKVEYIEEEFLQEDSIKDDTEESNIEMYVPDNKQTVREEDKKSGIKKQSQKKQPIQCNMCGKLLSTKFRLKCHLRTHTGEKPYECKVCGKSFALSYNLKIHQRIHTGEKPLECDICSKKFTQATGLISHQRLHTGENPYMCHLCPKGFKTTSHLKYHIRLHTGEKNHVCPTCKKAFITKSDLSQHLKVHTGERPHVCTICGMRLGRAYHLERHMITHTGEKKFKCDVCGQAYAQNYDLKRHMKIHVEKRTRSAIGKESSKNNSENDIIVLEFLVDNETNEKGSKEIGGS